MTSNEEKKAETSQSRSFFPAEIPALLTCNHSLEVVKTTGHMETRRGSCLEQVHARQVWLLGVFECHIFFLGFSTFSGSGLPFFSECWSRMEVRVPVLPRPPAGTENPPREACFAGVLGWSCPAVLAPGFSRTSALIISLLLIPQCVSLGTGQPQTQERPAVRAEVPAGARGWERGQGRFNSPSPRIIWI